MTQMLNYLYTNFASIASYIFTESTSENMKETLPFGAAQWKQYGLTVKEPEIPERFKLLLETPCHFWPNQKIKETHFLCLIPKGLTYDELLKLVSSEKSASLNFGEADWILITKKIVPKTSTLPFATQDEFLSTMNYDIPHAIEAAIGVLCAKHHNIPTFSTREASTRCQEKENSSYLVIGMDSKKNICSYTNNWDMHPGVAGVMR